MPDLISVLTVFSSILAVIFLFFGVALWATGDRRGRYMFVGAVGTILLIAFAPHLTYFFFGTKGETLKAEPLIIVPYPTAFGEKPQYIHYIAIKYVDKPIKVTYTFENLNTGDKAHGTITVKGAVTHDVLTYSHWFPSVHGWKDNGTYSYEKGIITFTYTYDGKTYTNTYTLMAYKQNGFSAEASFWVKLFLSFLTIIIKILGAVLTKLFVVILDPLEALIFFTTLPPTSLAGFKELYALMYRIMIPFFGLGLILNALSRTFEGDSRAPINALIDGAIAVIWMSGALQVYYFLAQFVNSIVLNPLIVNNLVKVASTLQTWIGSLFFFGSLGILSSTFGFFTVMMLFALIIMGAMAVLRYLGIAAMVIMQPIYAILWLIPWTRRSLMGGIRYILMSALSGIALAIIIALAANIGGAVYYLIPIMLIFAPWALQGVAQGTVSGIGREGIATSQLVFSMSMRTGGLSAIRQADARFSAALANLGRGKRGGGGGSGGSGGLMRAPTQLNKADYMKKTGGTAGTSAPTTGGALEEAGFTEAKASSDLGKSSVGESSGSGGGYKGGAVLSALGRGGRALVHGAKVAGKRLGINPRRGLVMYAAGFEAGLANFTGFHTNKISKGAAAAVATPTAFWKTVQTTKRSRPLMKPTTSQKSSLRDKVNQTIQMERGRGRFAQEFKKNFMQEYKKSLAPVEQWKAAYLRTPTKPWDENEDNVPDQMEHEAVFPDVYEDYGGEF